MGKFDRNTKPSFSIVVSGDIATYSKGEVLTKTSNIADYWRELCSLGDVTLTMDDEQIVAIAASVSGQPAQDASDADLETWEYEVCNVLESRNKGNDVTGSKNVPLPDTRIADMTATGTSAIAALFDSNELYRKSVHDAAYAPEKVKVSPLNLLRAYLDVFKMPVDNRGLIADLEKSVMFSKIPHPDSEPDADYLKKNGGRVLKADENKFAKYKKIVSGKEETFDWFEDWFLKSVEGKEIVAELDLYKAGHPGRGRMSKQPTGKYANMEIAAIENKVFLWKGRLTAGIKYIKMAAAAMYQWKDIVTDLGDNVGVAFMMDNKGKDNASITEGFACLRVYDAKDPGFQRPYSISGFNNLDVERAVETGSTWSDLVNSTKQGPRETPSKAIAWDMDVFIDNRTLLATWLDTKTVAELESRANQRVKGTKDRTEEAEQLIVDICGMYRSLGHFYHLFGGLPLQTINEKRTKQDNAEAAQEALVRDQKQQATG